MKRMLTLLTVTVVLVNSVGCCCRGLRDWCFQGAFCGPRAAVPAPMYATAPYASPYASPYAAPAASVPVFAHCAPQQVAPQYAVAAPVAYTDAACGMPYMTEMGCGVPYTEMGCGFEEGVVMPSPAMYPGPAFE